MPGPTTARSYRPKLLPKLHGDDATLGAKVRADLELVRNAFFTSPEDSSAWFYHRWLLAQLRPGGAAEAPAEEFAAILEDEATVLEELIELEPDCKWPLATAVFLRSLQAGGERAVDAAERLATLKRVDPKRTRYYDEYYAAKAVGVE